MYKGKFKEVPPSFLISQALLEQKSTYNWHKKPAINPLVVRIISILVLPTENTRRGTAEETNIHIQCIQKIYSSRGSPWNTPFSFTQAHFSEVVWTPKDKKHTHSPSLHIPQWCWQDQSEMDACLVRAFCDCSARCQPPHSQPKLPVINVPRRVLWENKYLSNQLKEGGIPAWYWKSLL